MTARMLAQQNLNQLQPMTNGHHGRPCHSSRHRGLSLAEVMISLAISALLLTAVAVAFSATTSAIEVNDRFFRASQAARVAMGQMVAAARKSDSAQVGTTAQQSLNQISNASNLDIITTEGDEFSYVYDSTRHQLQMVIPNPSGDITRILARDVESARFDAAIEAHPDTGVRRLVRVSMTIIIKIGNQELLLSGSAVPRREMIY